MAIIIILFYIYNYTNYYKYINHAYLFHSCSDGNWSGWYDRDNPSGHGDYEFMFDKHMVGIYLIFKCFFNF